MTLKNLSSTPRVWFITGCSTGLGRSLSKAVLASGDRLVVTARKLEQVQDLVNNYPEHAFATYLDVTYPDDVREAVTYAIKTFGRIDVLVNNAGYGLMGAIEEVEDSEIRRQFETNVFGALNVIQAVLPYMRAQQSGHILNISSGGGFASFPCFGIYNATKFALEGLSEALAMEVAHLNIKVTIVEPGEFRTDWWGRSLVRSPRIEAYAPISDSTYQWVYGREGQQLGDPDRAAKAMIEVVNAAEPPLRLALGVDSLEHIRKKLTSVAKDLKTWEHLTTATAFLKS